MLERSGMFDEEMSLMTISGISSGTESRVSSSVTGNAEGTMSFFESKILRDC